MIIIGCDFHPRFQQIAFVNEATGEYGTARLEHGNGEAERFYRRLQGQAVRVRMEASGQSLWFEQLLQELGYELWSGDPARIRAAAVRKQKTDQRDADLILLLLERRFPRVWRPTLAQRDVRQLLLHRHCLVQMRTRLKNQLQALAMNQGVCQKTKLWSRAGRAQLQALPWAARRRTELMALHDELSALAQPLDQAVQQQARRVEVQRLMTHPGVGEVTALAFVLTVGDPPHSLCLGTQAGQLSGADSERGQQPGQATAGPHQQARQRAAARLADGGGPYRGTARAGVGPQLAAAGHEEESPDRHRRSGAQAGGAVVVDVDSRTRLWADVGVRFACRVIPLSPLGCS